MGTYKDVEVSVYNYDLLKRDGIHCTLSNDTAEAIPLSYVFFRSFSPSEINCYYANIPLFFSYEVLISTQQEFSIQYFSTNISLDGLSYRNEGTVGCTYYDPTLTPTSEVEPRRSESELSER